MKCTIITVFQLRQHYFALIEKQKCVGVRKLILNEQINPEAETKIMFLKIFFLLLVSIFSTVQPYSNGAPEETCPKKPKKLEESMSPGHGLEPQPNDQSIPTTCTVNKSKFISVLPNKEMHDIP